MGCGSQACSRWLRRPLKVAGWEGDLFLHPPGVQPTIPGMLTPPVLEARLVLSGYVELIVKKNEKKEVASKRFLGSPAF